MALWPRLARSTVWGQDQKRHALPEAGVQAQRTLLPARWQISTGPKTDDGLARLTAARTTHGKYTKEKRGEAKRFAVQGRQMRAELAELEEWFVDHGHLDKNWRDWFKLRYNKINLR